jgi:hypothetical protein
MSETPSLESLDPCFRGDERGKGKGRKRELPSHETPFHKPSHEMAD